MAIFNSYVKLPEGINHFHMGGNDDCFTHMISCSSWFVQQKCGKRWKTCGKAPVVKLEQPICKTSNKLGYGQWQFQDPKLEVPTIYKAYFSGLCKGISPQYMAWNMVLTYLHFRILKFPLIWPREPIIIWGMKPSMWPRAPVPRRQAQCKAVLPWESWGQV